MAETAATVGAEQQRCSASGVAASRPPVSWATRLSSSSKEAGPTAAVAAMVVAPVAAGVSYARAVSPAAADAPVLHGAAGAHAVVIATDHLEFAETDNPCPGTVTEALTLQEVCPAV